MREFWSRRCGRRTLNSKYSSPRCLRPKPRLFDREIAEIAPDSAVPTGYVAPRGWYGFVAASGPGLIRLALAGKGGYSNEEGMKALASLALPEPESRNSEFEGRRMIRIDGGYVILNFMRYRDHDSNAKVRMSLLRARRKAEHQASSVTEHVPECSGTVTEAEADTDTEEKREAQPAAARPPGCRLPKTWEPSDELMAWAREKYPGVNVHAELESFRDYWHSKAGAGAAKTDWDATFRNWVRRSQSFAARSQGAQEQPQAGSGAHRPYVREPRPRRDPSAGVPQAFTELAARLGVGGSA